MRKIILANVKSINPARQLRDVIEYNTGVKCRVFASTKYLKHDDEVIIRYANASAIICKDTKYNQPSFISLCGNKLITSQELVRNNINTITFFNHREKPDTFPVVIRKTLYGQGGEGIVVVKNQEEFEENNGRNYYYSNFFRFTSEYRIHVLGGQIARIFKKVRQEGVERKEFPIRNLKNGYDFSLRSNVDAFPKFKELVNKLTPVLTGKFYALDIGMYQEEPYVIEINSGPGLSSNTADYYANYLIKELNLGG